MENDALVTIHTRGKTDTRLEITEEEAKLVIAYVLELMND